MNNIVGRIQVPNTTDSSCLYIKLYEGASLNFSEGCREVTFLKGGVISLNSYFNSFYEKFYAKYTELEALYYLLQLEGDFQISIYREFYGRENRDIIHIDNFENCQLSDFVKILLPNISQNDDSGRVYLEITCLSKFGVFTGGLVVTDQVKNREVSLGIVTCTFKKEVYIKNTVNNILKDNLLKQHKFKIFIVDNGKTLNADDFADPKVQLIPNKNVGGSGGFTRGLLEALMEEKYTHFLLMDDDIELDSESIYRLYSLYEYAKHDFAVAGSKLDLYKKHILEEAGALYGKCAVRNINHPFSVALLKQNLDLQNPTSLNLLLLEEIFDYGGFWLFSFSKEILEKIGLPMPFFIQRDDIEFCLRIKERLGGEIIAFPSIAVWHEPPYANAKNPVWLGYYLCRNNLITHSIHRNLRYDVTVKFITKSIIVSLLFFDYTSAAMLVKAFEDYMKGPAFIQNNDSELLHFNILELSKSYKSQNVQRDYLNNHFPQESNKVFLKKLVSLLTINGHLLPFSIKTDGDALIRIGTKYSLSKQWYNVFPNNKVVIFKEEHNCFYQNELDKLAGIKILAKWFKIAIKSSIRWSSISAEWKDASRNLTSTEFWQQHLDLKT